MNAKQMRAITFLTFNLFSAFILNIIFDYLLSISISHLNVFTEHQLPIVHIHLTVLFFNSLKY